MIIQAGIVPVTNNERRTPAVTATSVVSCCDDYSATRPDGRGPRETSALTVDERYVALRNLKTLAAGDKAAERRGAKYREIGASA